MSDHEPDRILAAVDALAPAFERAGLDELEVTVGELRVRLARPRAAPVPVASAAAATPSAPAAIAPGPTARTDEPPPFDQAAPGRHLVTAPLTGIWYSAPSPGARPYVTEGAEVTAGQVIGLIEAMKLFNEIKSDQSGTVTRFLVESGTLVKRKQPLIEVDPG
ncbi:MAG TPA: biotin/lipoyl-containing protein [Candidatus Limnocylindria bacterium]|nr:biotin/lipoyl-containing protein [Candidatus Limnocylindria bacterium]